MTNKVLMIGGGVIVLLIIVAGIRVGLLLRSVGGYRSYWQKEAAKTPPAGALTYIAMGDSTAQGIGASSPRRGYVGLVAASLARESGKPVHVINISVSGAKVADAIKTQLSQLATLPKASYVTIEIGANDMSVYDETKFRQEFSDLLGQLPADTYVSNVPSFRGGRQGSLDKNAQAANRVIAELTLNQPNLRFVDLYAATSQQNLTHFGADLFHPSNKGYKNWERAFTQEISKNPLAK